MELDLMAESDSDSDDNSETQVSSIAMLLFLCFLVVKEYFF